MNSPLLDSVKMVFLEVNSNQLDLLSLQFKIQWYQQQYILIINKFWEAKEWEIRRSQFVCESAGAYVSVFRSFSTFISVVFFYFVCTLAFDTFIIRIAKLNLIYKWQKQLICAVVPSSYVKSACFEITNDTLFDCFECVFSLKKFFFWVESVVMGLTGLIDWIQNEMEKKNATFVSFYRNKSGWVTKQEVDEDECSK